MTGGKRHVVSYTGDLLLSADIHAANENESKSGFRVIKSLYGKWESPCGGINQPDLPSLPKCRVVERTFSWIENFRRLAKDSEFRISTSMALMLLAFIALMLNRIYSQ